MKRCRTCAQQKPLNTFQRYRSSKKPMPNCNDCVMKKCDICEKEIAASNFGRFPSGGLKPTCNGCVEKMEETKARQEKIAKEEKEKADADRLYTVDRRRVKCLRCRKAIVGKRDGCYCLGCRYEKSTGNDEGDRRELGFRGING